MKNIIFTHSYFLRFDPKQWATGQPYAPLGTMYAAAVMREHGYVVSEDTRDNTHRSIKLLIGSLPSISEKIWTQQKMKPV